MIIRNKATKKVYSVSQEEYAKIVAHPQLRGKYSVIDTKEISSKIIIDSETMRPIIPEEILNFRKLNKIKTKTKKKKNE